MKQTNQYPVVVTGKASSINSVNRVLKLGLDVVVVPKAMGQGGKKQKTDKRDSAELCDALERYLVVRIKL